MLNKTIIFLFYSLFAISVKAKISSCELLTQTPDTPLKYAELFKLKFNKEHQITFVGLKKKHSDASFQWWALSNNVDNSKKYLSNCSNFKLMKFPSRAISTSTTHLSFIADIEASDYIKGFTQTSMISSQMWKSRIQDKKLDNLPLALNVEHFIKGKYDLLLTYPESSFDDLIAAFYSKSDLREVTLLPVVEYLEESALGRMEWIKFFGAIFNKNQQAKKLFTERETKYLQVVSQIKKLNNKTRPKVILGEVLNNKWVYPSSKSDFISICNDLNLDVIRPMISSSIRKNIGPDFFHLEEMLSIVNKADYWILTSAYFDKNDLLKKHSLYKNFSAKTIISLSKKKNSNQLYHGFWEEGINRPDILIQDLAHYLYPEAFAKYNGVWFNELL